ncbi:phosphate/phosphite/phosphonate ABC transporter substrate-binding protein [Phytoactinopolyspora endophytica]|uniref:phosphate/phosphite/phosphonate ABC transporter substrate-binding protein n=1 Tax=Phytoactinopolyspora endophytica TaxID=1642495 RepID=UPI00101DD891|nr:phosphate/phosphite/phosphonate ABC transporter substrate-binding protein [Phytoactinopolyspora endophytica]
MRTPSVKRGVLLAAVLALTTWSCSSDDSGETSDETTELSAENPAAEGELTFAVPPGADDPELLAQLDTMSGAVAEATGREIQQESPASYLGVVEAVRNGHVDVAMLSPFAAALGLEAGSVDPLLVWGAEDQPASVCLSGIDSGIDNVEDVAGAQVAFVDPGSTTGHFMPRALFAEAGFEADEDYEMTFAGGHDSAILGLANGSVDVACTAAMIYPTFVEQEIIDESTMQKFAESGPIPIGLVIVVREDLDDATREALIDNLPGIISDDEGLVGMFGIGEVTANPEAEVFDPLVDIATLAGVDLEDVR